MRLLNPLKTLTWNSLFRASRSRLRRKLPGFAPLNVAAEVLEQRALLTAQVDLTTSASGAIQLTSETLAGNNESVSIEVQQDNLTSNLIFIVGSGTILHSNNGAFSDTNGSATSVSLSSFGSVKSITVNLGGGFDTFKIDGVSTQGNITFTGLGNGDPTEQDDGWDIEVFNDTANTMTVGTSKVTGGAGGSIIANLGTATYAQKHTYGPYYNYYNYTTYGPYYSTNYTGSNFNVYTFSGSALNVNGNIAVTDASGAYTGPGENPGNPWLQNGVDTGAGGNLTVTGSITMNSSGSGWQNNFIDTEGAGSLTVGTTATPSYVSMQSSGSGLQDNSLDVSTNNAGNLTVNGYVSIGSSGSGGINEVLTEGDGNLLVTKNVSLSSSGATVDQDNFIATVDNTGTLTVNGNVSITSSGSSGQFNQIDTDGADSSSGALLIKGNVSIISSGTGFQNNELYSVYKGGTLTVKGNVIFGASGSTLHFIQIYTAADVESTGSLTVNGAVSIRDSGNGTHANYIAADGGNVLIGGSISATDAGSGLHITELSTFYGSYTLTVNGGVAVTDTGTGSSDFSIGASVSYANYVLVGFPYFPYPVYDNGGGNVTIGGNVSYDNHTNTTNSDSVFIGGDVDTGGTENAATRIGGSLTLKLANTAAHENLVVLGYQEYYIQRYIQEESPETVHGKSLIVNGALNVTSGAGADQFYIQGVWIKGLLTLNTGTNPTTGPGDLIDIEGSRFDGSSFLAKNTITMSGKNAVIYIADSHGSGWDATTFKSGVQANMPGLLASTAANGDNIYVGGSSDGVTFSSNLYVYGKGPSTNGTLHIDGAAKFKLFNMTVNPVLVAWNKV